MCDFFRHWSVLLGVFRYWSVVLGIGLSVQYNLWMLVHSVEFSADVRGSLFGIMGLVALYMCIALMCFDDS